MPPRYSYWTILAGGLPTAFRAAEREELEPTFRRLREKHPDAEMKWFARGKLWESPEAARAERPYRDRERQGDAPARRRDEPPRPGEVRGRDWRPGGEHRDPRQKYKDAKKARNVERRQEKFARKQGGSDWRNRPPREKPHGDKLAPRGAGPRRFDKPAGPPRDDWRNRPPREKPHGDPLARGSRPFDRKSFPRGQGVEEEPAPPRPRGPNREPKPSETPRPTPPPRPSEPVVPPPGPPERGAAWKNRKPRPR